MSSGENGDLWFLNPSGKEGDHNNQRPSPPPTLQHSYQPSNATNPFNKFTQSPPSQDGYRKPQFQPPQGSPYSQQQGGPFPQHGSPYSQQAYYSPQQQQGVYPPQQGYPQQGQFSNPNSQAGGEASSFYDPGPPPGSGGPDQRGFFDSAMQAAGVQQPPPGPDGLERGWFSSSKNPLDPPPNEFKRPAPGHYAYARFQPMGVLAVSDRLQDGFALVPPVNTPGQPHPFVSHDITEGDWHKFLKDFQKTAHLSPSDRLFQSIGNNFMKDKVPSPNVQKRIAENKLEPIGDYLMAWNHYFFHPRRISVVLAMGNHRFSGETDDYPPDLGRNSKKASKEKKKKKNSQHKTHRGRSDSDDSDSSSSSSDDDESDDNGHTYGRDFRGGRGGLFEERRQMLGAGRGFLDERRQMLGAGRGFLDERRQMLGAGGGLLGERGDGRRARKEERRVLREEKRKARKEKRMAKHGQVEQSAFTPEVPSNRFRLVVCYWDGQEVY